MAYSCRQTPTNNVSTRGLLQQEINPGYTVSFVSSDPRTPKIHHLLFHLLHCIDKGPQNVVDGAAKLSNSKSTLTINGHYIIMRRLVCPLSYIVIVLSSVSISFVISFSVVPVRRAQSQATTRWHNNNRQSHPARRPFLSTTTTTQLFGEVNQKLVEQLIGQIAERQLLKESKEEDLVAIDREIEELYSQVERQVQELKAQKKNQQKELDSIRNDIAKRLQKLELAERGEIGSSSSSASQLLDLKRLGIDSEVATTVVATVSGLGVVAVAGRAALIQRKEDEERRERLRLEEEKQKELQRIQLEQEKAKAAETKKTTQLLVSLLF